MLLVPQFGEYIAVTLFVHKSLREKYVTLCWIIPILYLEKKYDFCFIASVLYCIDESASTGESSSNLIRKTRK